MKSCIGCAHAEWQLTRTGRLHPSGYGECEYPYTVPPLPQAFYWLNRPSGPCGGRISRNTKLKDHCLYYLREEQP